MKIYRISQISQDNQNTQDVAGTSEIQEAVSTIQNCIKIINQSLNTLQNYSLSKLFQKETLITEIQSGNVASLDQNKIQTSLEAMSKIATIIPTFNAALKVLQENDAIARKYNVDINNMQNIITSALQEGRVEFTAGLSSFQSMLPSSSGIQMPSNMG